MDLKNSHGYISQSERSRRKRLRLIIVLALGLGLVFILALVLKRGESKKTEPPRAKEVVKALPRKPAPEPWWKKTDIRQAKDLGGKLVQTLKSGTRITFTLDAKLNKRAKALLYDNDVPYGAFAAVEPYSGRVLALTGYVSGKPKAKNYALLARAPAASVFKLITSAALIAMNKAGPETQECFHGGKRRLGLKNMIDNPRRDRRCASLKRMIAWSLNAPIAKLALKHLKPNKLLSFARRFGFNRKIPFELPLETSSAQIPADKLGFGRTAAGFGAVKLSALHGALLAAVFANGGKLKRPYIIAKVESPREGVLAHGNANTLGQPISRRVAAQIKMMMAYAVSNGSARRRFVSRRGRKHLGSITVAAKTGSLTIRGEELVDFSWLVGFAPVKRPEIAFGAVVGNSHLWHIKSGDLAAQSLKTFFRKKLRSQRGKRSRPRGRRRR